MVMNPNTGEIYAMAAADKFDLNDPSKPLELETDAEFQEARKKLSPSVQKSS